MSQIPTSLDPKLSPVFRGNSTCVGPSLAFPYRKSSDATYWTHMPPESMTGSAPPVFATSSEATFGVANVPSSPYGSPQPPTIGTPQEPWLLVDPADALPSTERLPWASPSSSYRAPADVRTAMQGFSFNDFITPTSDSRWDANLEATIQSPYFRPSSTRANMGIATSEWDGSSAGSLTPEPMPSSIIDYPSPMSSFSQSSAEDDGPANWRSNEYFHSGIPYSEYMGGCIDEVVMRERYGRIPIPRHERHKYYLRRGNALFPLGSLSSSDKKLHVCNAHLKKGGVCGKGFTRPEHLKRHARTHMGQKDHRCKICDKPFDRKDNCHDHYWTHLDRPGKTGKNHRVSMEHILQATKDEKLIDWLGQKLEKYLEVKDFEKKGFGVKSKL